MSWLLLPPWSLRLIALGAMVVIAIAIFRAVAERRHVPLRRQWPSLLLRGVAMAVLLAIVLNPTALLPETSEHKPMLVVLLDTSYSMATADASPSGTQPRLESAMAVLGDPRTRARLEDHFTLDLRTFDRSLRPAPARTLTAQDADGRASDLAAAISSAVGDLDDAAEQAGVLVVSDGRATSPGATEAARLALARSVPLWTWVLGGKVDRKDLWIETAGSEVLAFSGSEVELSATLRQVGYDDRSFGVELVDEGGNVVATAPATPGPSGAAPVKMKVTAPDEGERRYTLRVAVDEAEAQKQNNDRSIYLRVVGQKVRVLVVEGQPHWDTKFLIQSLKRNPRVDVTALYRLGPDKQFAVVSAGGDEQRRITGDLFPRSAEDFAQYEVVIMGRGCEAFFDDRTEELLTDFVAQHGGALVFSRGKSYGGRYAALAKLEPVVWGSGLVHGAKMEPAGAETGGPIFQLAGPEDLEAVLDHLPRFDQVTQTMGVKPLAVVMASAVTPQMSAAGDEPVIMAYHLYGQGRVVTLNAGGLWHWSFRDHSEQVDEAFYDRFWDTLLRWLLSGSDFLAGQNVALRTDRRLYTDEQPIRLMVRTRGLDTQSYRPKVTIQRQDPKAQPTVLEPRPQPGGAYFAEAGPFPPGDYTLALTSNGESAPPVTQQVRIVSGSIENQQLSADPDLMRQLAELSNGQVVTDQEVAELDRVVRQWQARQQLADQKASLWDRPWVMAIIMLALGTEWYLRRREGLL